jgi:2-polyprenyl-3-methyl-5-hydroxy-6-metoxy-1,4-benzoquinol methylase
MARRRIEIGVPYLSGRVLDFGCHHGVLTKYCTPQNYVGVEIDPIFLESARAQHPEYTFTTMIPAGEKFDTVAAFAVIEHLADPGGMLGQWADALPTGGRVVMTTPHPKFEWIHTAGAKVGVFSGHAHDDHEDLIDKSKMVQLGRPAGLDLDVYKRFMFGANQLFVMHKR